MNFETMNIEELETRAAEIVTELAEADREKIEELNKELDAIEERKRVIEKETAETRAKAAAVAAGAGEVVHEEKEERKMDVKEIRNSKEYVNAYAEYLKTGDDMECRKILTENAPNPGQTDGVVPVPTFVEAGIKTAWENDAIFSRVRRTYAKGNLKIGFERQASDATEHNEGSSAPTEEILSIGTVSLVPTSVKKWISFSDELYDMSEEFLSYIYDELTYKIIQYCKMHVGTLVDGAPAVSTQSAVGIPAVEGAPTAETLVNALGLLSDEATEPVAVMNKQTWATIKAAALNAGYAYDPFAGMAVAFDNTLSVYEEADADSMYMYVADLGRGVTANFPNGDDVKLKFDDLSLAERDLIKVVGRLYVAIGLTAPGMIVKVTKPNA